MLSNSRILVTGGAGFIGSNLVEALLGQDNDIVCLDNFFTGHRRNIEPFLANPSFSLIEGDIRDLDTCRHACSGIDFVLHQAAVGSVPRSIENPIVSTEVNIMGFLNMLVGVKKSKASGRPRIYASFLATPPCSLRCA